MDLTHFDFGGFLPAAVTHPELHQDYWRAVSPAERFSAVEVIRRFKYLDYPPDAPMARVMEVGKLSDKDVPPTRHFIKRINIQ